MNTVAPSSPEVFLVHRHRNTQNFTHCKASTRKIEGEVAEQVLNCFNNIYIYYVVRSSFWTKPQAKVGGLKRLVLDGLERHPQASTSSSTSVNPHSPLLLRHVVALSGGLAVGRSELAEQRSVPGWPNVEKSVKCNDWDQEHGTHHGQ